MRTAEGRAVTGDGKDVQMARGAGDADENMSIGNGIGVLGRDQGKVSHRKARPIGTGSSKIIPLS